MCSKHFPAAQYLACAVLAFALLVPGCSSKPRAPALEDDAVYHNPEAGFRFLVPTGWGQRAKAVTPSGKVPKEHLLVQYQRVSGDGLLEVSLSDAAESEISTFLSAPSHGTGNWQATGAPAQITVGGASATRLVFTGLRGKIAMTKEVVVFRRGARAYLVTGIFPTADKESREQIRSAVGSMIWRD